MENLEMIPTTNFWRGKKVLVTGHTGFKGGWLSIWLQRMGANLCGISLKPLSTPNLFELANVAMGMDSYFLDIRESVKLEKIVRHFQPELIFHLAAQPVVRASYADPLETYSTNIMGTAHLLNALRNLSCTKVAVMVTTDKVYQNNEWHYPYRENDPLNGHDPYSASKAASEIVISSYRSAYLQSQGIAVASARAGNVIGGGDWSEDRLIPDAVRAWQNNKPLQVRRPEATRPWQHVLEPLRGYLTLAEKLWDQPHLAGAYNFGPHTHEAANVRKVIELARKSFGQGEVVFGSDLYGPHEAAWLALETSKSREILGVHPHWPLEVSIERTMNWYRSVQEGLPARNLCETEIETYEHFL